jgi:hypothetical protein
MGCGASSTPEIVPTRAPTAAPVTVPAIHGGRDVAVPLVAPAREVLVTQALSEARTDKFLVRTSEGAIEVRSASAAGRQVLIPHAQLALYDPALELIWYIEENQLSVFDLRKPADAPVVIVRDMQDMIDVNVARAQHIVSAEDGCEGPYADLQWSATPKIEPYLSEVEHEFVIDGRSWLQEQLTRTERPVLRRSGFDTQKRLRLQKKIMRCDMDDVCGSTVAFGDTGAQLVVIHTVTGGDCFTQSCLLHDPRSKRFASPLHATEWGPAAAALRGPCGIYRFDQSKAQYLVGSWLCRVDGGCQHIDGTALGWLEPGAEVGDVGAVDTDE